MSRDELYKKFGPCLLEAVVMLVKDEINTLRAKAGLPERTNQQIVNGLENKLTAIQKYAWMDDKRG